LSSEEFATRLVLEEKVAVVPGSAFGESGEGFIRISYAYSIEELKEAFEHIKSFIERLRAEKKSNQ
jgi:aminotransferase